MAFNPRSNWREGRTGSRESCFENVVFVSEQIVEGADAHLGVLGEPAHGERVDPAADDPLACGIEDPSPSSGFARGSAMHHFAKLHVVLILSNTRRVRPNGRSTRTTAIFGLACEAR